MLFALSCVVQMKECMLAGSEESFTTITHENRSVNFPAAIMSPLENNSDRSLLLNQFQLLKGVNVN